MLAVDAHTDLSPGALASLLRSEEARADVYLRARGIPLREESSVLRLTPAQLEGMGVEARRNLRRTILETTIPALTEAQANRDLWTLERGGDWWGYLPSRMLP